VPKEENKKPKRSKKRIALIVLAIIAGIVAVQNLLYLYGSRKYLTIPEVMALDPIPAEVTLIKQRSLCLFTEGRQVVQVHRRYSTQASPDQVRQAYDTLTAERGWVRDTAATGQAPGLVGFQIVHKGNYVDLDVSLPLQPIAPPGSAWEYTSQLQSPTWRRTCNSGNVPFVDVPSTHDATSTSTTG
jgi:hypothetical protein